MHIVGLPDSISRVNKNTKQPDVGSSAEKIPGSLKSVYIYIHADDIVPARQSGNGARDFEADYWFVTDRIFEYSVFKLFR